VTKIINECGKGKDFQQLAMEAAFNVSGARYYVSGDTGSDAKDGKSWSKAKKTIQAAVDRCGNGTNDVIFVSPLTGDVRYNENVLIKGHDGLKIIGVGCMKDTVIRASDATTKLPFTPVGEAAVLGCCMAIMSADVEVRNLCFDASGNYVGLYVGDGYRIDETYAEEAGNGIVANCIFRYGTIGIVYDGADQDLLAEGNYLYKQSVMGIHIGPGGTKQVQRISVRGNTFFGCEDYGVYLYDTNETKNIMVDNNVFFDQTRGTIQMTNPIKFQGTGCHGASANRLLTANGISGAATDGVSGNYEAGNAANAATYVTEA